MGRAPLLALFLLPVALGCGNGKASPPQGIDRKEAPTMTTTTTPPQGNTGGPLPVEPGSNAELLSATHLFTIEIVTAATSAWVPGNDGLQHRTLKIEARLSAILKGTFAVPAGQSFQASLDQKQESDLFENDYHGLWSHVAPPPAPGVQYFVVTETKAQGPQDPARLLQEDVCKRVGPPAEASDVALAQQGEAGFRSVLSRGGDGARDEASRALLGFAGTHAASARGPFGRYVLERITASLESSREVREELVSLLARPDATPDLRLEAIGAVETEVAETSVDRDFLVGAARALAGLLMEPRAASAHQRIATASLFSAVFPEEGAPARLKPADVVPDPAQRPKIAAALRAVNHPHAAALATWLSH